MSWSHIFGFFSGLPSILFSWTWLAAGALFLLVGLLLFLWRPASGQDSQTHGEPWVFSPPAAGRFAFFLFRFIGIAVAGILIAAIILAIAHPVLISEEKDSINAPARVFIVVDTSGSIECSQYQRYIKFFDALTNGGADPSLAVGLYFFSSNNLVHVYPNTNHVRTRKILVRFGPQCGMRTISQGPGPFSYSYMASTMTVYGTGSGTEPGPSVYDALTDALRFSEPELVPHIRWIQNQRGFRVLGTPGVPVVNFFPPETRDDTVTRLRAAVKGERVLFFTDTEFSLESGEIAIRRVLELAALMGLPVDLAASITAGGSMNGGGGAGPSGELKKFLEDTGGVSYIMAGFTPESVIQAMALRYRALVLKGIPPPRVLRRPVYDDTPRAFCIMVSILALGAWACVRILYPIVDY